MALYPLEFGEKVYDTCFEHRAPTESRQTGPGGFKARERVLLSFPELCCCFFFFLSDFEMLLYLKLCSSSLSIYLQLGLPL